jgi:chorismate mutase
MQQSSSSSATPLYQYSHGRGPMHTSYRQQSFPQHQMPQGILRNGYQQAGNNPSYNQQHNLNGMVPSLMAQLRQKEAELAKYKVTYDEFQKAEQNNHSLRSRLDAQAKSMAEKDKKIAMLVGKLNLEKRANGSAVADAIADTKIKRLSEQLEEYKREIKSRDEEIARLSSENKTFMVRAIASEKRASYQTNFDLEQDLEILKEDFDQLTEQNSTFKNTIEELVKRVKKKEWMINSLKSESEEHRSRETRLNAQVTALKHTIESCDIVKKNSDVDVAMLLAKLADYEAQALLFQNQKHQSNGQDTKLLFKMDEESVLSKEKKFDDGTTIVSNDCSMGDTNTIDDTIDDDDGSTFVTMKTMDDTTFAPTTASTKYNCIDDFNPKNQVNVFNDLMEEVTDGFQSIRTNSVMCGVTNCFSSEETMLRLC